MNSKLIILIFAFIGFQTINSSILKNQLVNSENWIEVDEINYVNEDDELAYYFGTPETKEFTLNKSETVVVDGKKLPEVRCLDRYFESDVPNKFCSMGNGKYQFELVRCRRNVKQEGPRYKCLFIAKIINKNVQISLTSLSCNSAIFHGGSHKGNCAFKYAFQHNEFHDEKDDILTDEF